MEATVAKKVKKPAGVALVLCIRRDRYRLREIPTEIHDRAWEIRKKDGTVYHLSQDGDGTQACDCAGGTYRDKCKHMESLRRLGFMKPERVPTPIHIDVYA
jgi:hypothetical protein